MCLIIHRPGRKKGKGFHVPDDYIHHNRKENPDGFGLAWREGGCLLHAKFGPEQFAEFSALQLKLDRDQTIEYVAHFRKATHGPPCQELSHPFTYTDPKANDDVLVFHNGIISIPTHKTESDTQVFVDTILPNFPSRWWRNKTYKWAIEEAIGWSRLLVMTDQETVRLNETLWDQIGGIWYSCAPVPKTKQPKNWGQPTYDFEDEKIGQYTLLPDDIKPTPPVAVPVPGGWYQIGHKITPVTQEDDSEGDKFGTAVCEKCQTSGEFYVIQGKVYIDISHIGGAT